MGSRTMEVPLSLWPTTVPGTSTLEALGDPRNIHQHLVQVWYWNRLGSPASTLLLSPSSFHEVKGLEAGICKWIEK